MRYFLDCEFIEGFHKPLFGNRRHFIDLISIGLVCENEITYSAISSEYRYKDADHWVQKNVIDPLYVSTVHGDNRNRCESDNFHRSGYGLPNEVIAKDLRGIFEYDIQYGNSPIEIYGYYADYDWVLFCSLFGRMIDLPKGLPMYCRDLKQMMDEKVSSFSNSDFFTHFHQKEPLSFEEKLKLYKGGPNFPQQDNEHNALSDAKWNKKLYEYLTK